jgi:glycosyl transferase family 2
VAEVVVVTDATDGGNEAVAAGCRVVRLRSWQGAGQARNSGAAAAGGDLLVFVRGDAEVQPGWTAALARHFSLGAGLIAGEIEAGDRQAVARGRAPAPDDHDLPGRNGFLPAANISNLAIRSEVFTQLGGFDPLVCGLEDRDLSFRAQLAGHHITWAPEAKVTLPRRQVSRVVLEELQSARARAALGWKYRYFVFHEALAAADPPATAGPRLPLTLTTRSARARGGPLAPAAAGIARSIGHSLGWLELLSGWRGVPTPLQPADGCQELTGVALPRSPSLLLIGEHRFPVSLLAGLVNSVPDVAAAPPGLIETARADWDREPPWSMRLARSAAVHGWDIDLELAARRLEHERPRTWLEACLALHAIHAWLSGRRRFAVAVAGPPGLELIRRLPRPPVVAVGGDHLSSRIALRFRPSRLLLRPGSAAAQLQQLIYQPGMGEARAHEPTDPHPGVALARAGSQA